MKVDLVILGAGPTGLEAALAAAEANLDFHVFEQGDKPAAAVRTWQHMRMFSGWDLNVSPRARRALRAAELPIPTGTESPTGRELVQRVLEPLAQLPQIASRLDLGWQALAIGREGTLKQDEIGTGERRHRRFRILLKDRGGRERLVSARAVLDCTGAMARPNWVGDGGIPAPGEQALGERVVHQLPDLERQAATWRGRSVLLVGSGHSAQTAALALMALGGETRVLWLFRRDAAIKAVPDDPLAERDRLHRRCAELLASPPSHLEVRPWTVIDSFEPAAQGPVRVHLRDLRKDRCKSTVAVHRLLGLVGSVGDDRIYRELQVHECYATAGPMQLAAKLLETASAADCLASGGHGIELLENPEPGFFILGSKSYGKNGGFLMRTGWEQVGTVLERITEELPAREAEPAPA